MHGNTLKAAVTKHGHLSGDELAKALREDPKDYNEAEQREIYDAIGDQIRQQLKDMGTNEGPQVAPGKALYDKWRGSWVPVDIVTNPFDGTKMVITWRFDRLETKPNKTNIPLTPRQAELFNTSRQLEAAITPTEQLYPAGDTTPIYHRKPNPFQVQTLQ